MKKKKWLMMTIAASLLFGSIALEPERASACSCAVNESVAEERNRSDAVFEGTVIGRKQTKKLFNRSSADPVAWTFQVHEVWKGGVVPEITVQSAMSGASCGFEFEQGRTYLVYARDTGEGRLDVSLCSRTALSIDAAEDKAELGAGSVPPQPESGQTGSRGGIGGWIAPALLLAAAAVAAAAMAKRRRNRTEAK
mgnify:CR=1 FL=1